MMAIRLFTIKRNFFGIGKVTIGETRNVLPGNACLEVSIRELNLSYIKDFLDNLVNSISIEKGIKIGISKGAECPEVNIDSHFYDIEKVFYQ